MVSKANQEDVFVDVLRELVITISNSAGITESQATDIANDVLQQLRKRYGNQVVYISAKDKAEKNRQILADWNGNNIDQLVTRYKVSRRRIYQILNER